MNRFGAMIGVSSSMKQVFGIIGRVAPTEAPVLIMGESGTGKELVAREIHRLSNRSEKPFICWNCGAITETLAISELFGHEKGAFTGAINKTLGKFELANGGTLFMDEIASLPVLLQAAILRAIQEKEIMRVGGQENINIDVRIIAASNQDFAELISDERFRLDLYYRLSTVVLKMPPLRERQEDIPFLIWEFMQEFRRKYGYPMPRIPKSAMETFVNHQWPGNIRELRNAVENCIILGQGKTFSLEWLDEIFRLDKTLEVNSVSNDKELTSQQKKGQLHEILTRHGGNKSSTAKELGVSRKTIYDWLRKES